MPSPLVRKVGTNFGPGPNYNLTWAEVNTLAWAEVNTLAWAEVNTLAWAEFNKLA